MSQPKNLRCYDYVNQPYERVRAALMRDASGLFQRATKSAASRARSLTSTLHVNVGALEVGANVETSSGAARSCGAVFGETQKLQTWRITEAGWHHERASL